MYSVKEWVDGRKNIVFVGESGCGKSELAMHFALELAKMEKMAVHLFDLDQTKPLFRSRDKCSFLYQKGVLCHSEEQLLDTPTLVGGIQHSIEDEGSYTILDAGGNETGAHLLGGLVSCFKRKDTVVGFIINPYRPWSKNIQSIDSTLTGILRAARISEFHIIGNPSIGRRTTAEEFLEGCRLLADIVRPYVNREFVAVMDSLYEKVKDKTAFPLMPIHPCLNYQWESE